MNSRKKYIIAVLSLWIILFGISFLVAKDFFVSDFEKLEKKSAVEASQRISRTLISDLVYIDLLNAGNAIWDDTWNYIKKPNNEYIEENFSESFFQDSNINEVILMSLDGKVI